MSCVGSDSTDAYHAPPTDAPANVVGTQATRDARRFDLRCERYVGQSSVGTSLAPPCLAPSTGSALVDAARVAAGAARVAVAKVEVARANAVGRAVERVMARVRRGLRVRALLAERPSRVGARAL